MKECDLESLRKFFSGIFVVVMGFINPTGSYLMALVLAFGFNILAGLRADEGKFLYQVDMEDMEGIQEIVIPLLWDYERMYTEKEIPEETDLNNIIEK